MATTNTPDLLTGAGRASDIINIGSGKFVALYSDTGADTINAIVGQVNASDGAITYGAPIALPSADADARSSIAYDSTNDRIAIAYPGNLNHLFVVVGVVSGLSITFGSGVEIYGTRGSNVFKIAFDEASGKLITVHSDTVDDLIDAYVGEVSGLSSTWGTAIPILSSLTLGLFGQNDLVIDTTGDGRVLFIAESITNIEFAAATIGAGNTLTLGTALTASENISEFALTRTSSANKFVLSMTDGSDSVYAQQVNITSNNIDSLGPSTLITNLSANYRSHDYDETNDLFVFAHKQTVVTPTVFGSLKSKSAILNGSGFTVTPEATDEGERLLETTANVRVGGVAANVQSSWHVVIYDNQSNQDVFIMSYLLGSVPQPDPECNMKPTKLVVKTPALPGQPGFSGQPYIPAYCVEVPCPEGTKTTVPVGTGTYEWICVEYQGPDESFNIGTGEFIEICNFTYAGEQDPDGPTMAIDHGYLDDRDCTGQECFPEQPYMPPIPGVPPTPAELAVEYDLGWNYTIDIDSGRNLAVSISLENVKKGTAGVAVGVSTLVNSVLEGIGKYVVFMLFEGNLFSIFKKGVRVYGAIARDDADVFTLSRYEGAIAVLRNDIVIWIEDDIFPYDGFAFFSANIYKALDSFCITEGMVADSVFIGTGGAEFELPPFDVIGGLYSEADFKLPAFQVDAVAYNHGGADITLNAFFAIGADRPMGWGMPELPRFAAEGFSFGTDIAYGQVELPGFSAFSGSGPQADAVVKLPAFQADGGGDFAIPVAVGADVAIAGLLSAALGKTGSIGGADVSLGAFDAVGADRDIYGEVDIELPAMWGIAGQLPAYDGILNGFMEGLEVVDFYGTALPLNSLYGLLPTLAGGLKSGAVLDVSLGGLEAASLQGTLDVVARFDITLPQLDMVSSATTWAIGEASGVLGDPLDGELYGGCALSGDLVGLDGDLTGVTGAVASIDGSMQGLQGLITATSEVFGVLDGTMGGLEALWGILDGEIVGLEGELIEQPLPVSEYVAWVMNLVHRGVTRYPGYPFDFIVRWRGQHYLANSTGLFLYGGDKDSGAKIDAAFALPPSDYGSVQEKRVPRLYLKGRTTGQLNVAVAMDEGDQHQGLADGKSGVDYRRWKLPRGIKGHLVSFEVSNTDGADFEVEQVDALIHLTERKI